MLNYYEILEVSEKASKEVIEKAYKALAKKYHPDLNVNNKFEAEEKMKQINEAFNVLIDDNKRANYDSILNKRREIERRKEDISKNNGYSNSSSVSNDANSFNSQNSFEDHNKIAYSSGYSTDKNDNFYVNTYNMDEKTKKKLQQKLQERYLEAYDAYLRERGYKLKYKWTFKRVMQLILAIFIFIAVCTILFFIPPIHAYCIDLYNENFVVKLFVDIIASFFKTIFSVFT